MAHIDDLFEQQTKQLLHQLCDALGIEQQDRTKSGLEKAIAGLKKPAFVGMDIAKDDTKHPMLPGDLSYADPEIANRADEMAERL